MGTMVNTLAVHRSTLASLRLTLLAEVGNVVTVRQVTSLIVILSFQIPMTNVKVEAIERLAPTVEAKYIVLVVHFFKPFISIWNIID
jgi:hypothetical protein